MSKTGAKLIASVGQHSRYLDADGDKVVGNRRGQNPPASQTWVITKVPVSRDPKFPSDPYERFTIYNNSYKKYLDYDGTKAILTDVKQNWEIQNVDDNHYKIVVDNGGRACSLNSDADDAPVTIKSFMGPNEEWTLEPAADPTPTPPPTGVRGILSVAFDDTAICDESWDVEHTCRPEACNEAYEITAELGGYVLRQNNAGNSYLGVVNNTVKTIYSKFPWDITPVNGNYKISHDGLCISILQRNLQGRHKLELSAYADSHQEWHFKEFPLKVAEGGAIVKDCPARQERA